MQILHKDKNLATITDRFKIITDNEVIEKAISNRITDTKRDYFHVLYNELSGIIGELLGGNRAIDQWD